ncbi:MAG: hypothetical protein V4574_16970 [Pseudomonadota bacterium]
MNKLCGAIALALGSASPALAQTSGCDAVVDGAGINVRQRPLDQDVPDYGRIGLRDAHTNVTCRIGEAGRLAECVSPLRDDRGPWLARQFTLWKVLDEQAGGCPLIGRSVRFDVFIDMHPDEADGMATVQLAPAG